MDIKKESICNNLVENYPGPIHIFDSKGNILFVNSSGAKVYGKKLSQLIGKNINVLFSKEVVNKLLKRHNEILKSGKSQIFEDLLPFGKELRWFSSNIQPISFDGEKSAILIISQDITEKKKIEEELQKLASIPVHTHELVNLSNIKGEMVFLNKAGEEMLGIGPKELTKHNIMEVIPEHLQELVKNELLPALMKGKTWEGDLEYKNLKTNKLTHVHARVFTIKDPKTKKIKYFANVSHDNTQRKQAEKNLKKEKEKATRYLDVAKTIIVALDIKGNITVLNQKGCEIIGLGEKPCSLIGKNWFNTCIPKRMREQVREVFNKLICCEIKPVEFHENLVLTQKKGERLIAWHNTLLKDENGKVIGILSSGEDITEKRKTEEALKQYQFVIEQSTQQIAFVDLKGNIFYANDAWAKGHQYKKEEFIGKNLSIFHPKEELPNIKKFNQILMKKGYHNGEVIHKRKDNSTYPTLMSNFVLKKNGKPHFLVGIAQDITEKKKAEEKLKKSEKRFYDIAMSSADWIWELDKNGKYVYVSGAVKKILGYLPKEIIGKTPFDFMPKEEIKMVKEIFQEILVKKQPIKDLENVNLTKYGKKVILSTNGIPILDTNGNLLGYRGIDKNITEKKNIELALKKSKEDIEKQVIERTKELKESQEKYKTIYNSSKDAIMILESPTWKFTAGNPATIKMFGVKDEKEFISRAPWEYSPKYQTDKKLSSVKAKEMIMKAMKEGSNFFDWTHKKITGENFSATVLLTKMKIGGKDILQATVRDVTNEKESERKLKKSYEDLKVLDKMKSNFLTISSHELKTPLTPTKIQVQMLLEGDLGKLTDDQKKSFEIIHRNMNRLDELIEDILEISRVKAEGFKLELGEVNLKDCIKEVFKSMDDVAKKKGIKLSYKIYSLPLIFVDRKRILEVLENLVNNAIKFTEKGSIIIEAKKQKDNVLVMVKDTGIGISKTHMNKIFQPFFQIEPTFTRKYGGTGLGLGISKGIIEQHKGKIWAKSELGKGSIFYFTLPLDNFAKTENSAKMNPEKNKTKFFRREQQNQKFSLKSQVKSKPINKSPKDDISSPKFLNDKQKLNKVKKINTKRG